MQDTIHMGWTGWLAMDKVVNPFLSQKQATPSYHLNDQFFNESLGKLRRLCSAVLMQILKKIPCHNRQGILIFLLLNFHI